MELSIIKPLSIPETQRLLNKAANDELDDHSYLLTRALVTISSEVTERLGAYDRIDDLDARIATLEAALRETYGRLAGVHNLARDVEANRDQLLALVSDIQTEMNAALEANHG